jgi:hypothetical protein
MRHGLPFLLCALAVIATGRADIASSLSADQVSQLKAGQMVVVSTDIPGGVWPQVTVYTLVNAPVPVISSVLRDYAHAQDFQPSIVSANVVAQPSPNVYNVEYTQKLPIFGTTSFTVQNTFAESKGSLSVKWTLLKSSMADVSDGSLLVEPYGSGSIMRYINYVKPKLGFVAGAAKKSALDSVKQTVTDLKTEAEKRAKK